MGPTGSQHPVGTPETPDTHTNTPLIHTHTHTPDIHTPTHTPDIYINIHPHTHTQLIYKNLLYTRLYKKADIDTPLHTHT